MRDYLCLTRSKLLTPHVQTHQAHEGLLTSAFGEQVKQRYLVFARAVDAYSTHLYSEWEQRVGAVATEKLKQPILCTLSASKGQSPHESVDSAGMKDSVGHTFNNPARSKGPVHQQSTMSADAKGSVGMPPPPYGVNFATELHMIIRESKYLDRMGFQVSPGRTFFLHVTRTRFRLFEVLPAETFRGISQFPVLNRSLDSG